MFAVHPQPSILLRQDVSVNKPVVKELAMFPRGGPAPILHPPRPSRLAGWIKNLAEFSSEIDSAK
jgi:hypothetical protein